jgi:hypothetical protein
MLVSVRNAYWQTAAITAAELHISTTSPSALHPASISTIVAGA